MLVYRKDGGGQMEGHYHRLASEKHSVIESIIGNSLWARETGNNGFTAGTYLLFRLLSLLGFDGCDVNYQP